MEPDVTLSDVKVLDVIVAESSEVKDDTVVFKFNVTLFPVAKVPPPVKFVPATTVAPSELFEYSMFDRNRAILIIP